MFGGGKILEQGNHKSLLQKRGVYFQMVRLISLNVHYLNMSAFADMIHFDLQCQAQALDR